MVEKTTIHKLPVWKINQKESWISDIEMSFRNDQLRWHVHVATVIDLELDTWPKPDPLESLIYKSKNFRFLFATLGK